MYREYPIGDLDTLQGFFDAGLARDTPGLLPMSQEGLIINLGGGQKIISNSITLGLEQGWNAEEDLLPYNNGTVDGVIAFHFLEHINNLLGILKECQRVLRSGAPMNIVVPYGSGHLAVQDPDHKRMFNEDTWRTLFNNDYYDKNGITWKFDIGVNFIMGVEHKNLALLTQLIKR